MMAARRASEFELGISVANVSHVIFARRESERRASEFELERAECRIELLVILCFEKIEENLDE